MATLKDINDQMSKLQDQKDSIVTQIDAINARIANIHKQIQSANGQNTDQLQSQLDHLNLQKDQLAGQQAQTNEDAEMPEVAPTGNASITTTTADGKFAPRFGDMTYRRKLKNKIDNYITKKLG